MRRFPKTDLDSEFRNEFRWEFAWLGGEDLLQWVRHEAMNQSTTTVQIKLYFTAGDPPRLSKSVVQLPQVKDPLLTEQSTRDQQGFIWSQAVKSLLLFLLGYVVWCKNGNDPGSFRFSGMPGEPADTLGNLIGNANPNWLGKMFGHKQQRANIVFWTGRINPEFKTNPSEPQLIYPLVAFLVAGNIHFFRKDNELTSTVELEDLANSIKSQWKGGPPSAADPILGRTTSVDPLKRFSLSAIGRRLATALHPSRGYELRMKAYTRFLAPDFINELAERLVQESVESFIKFFTIDYDHPPWIKVVLINTISVDDELSQELAEKVARSAPLDLMGWFQQVYSVPKWPKRPSLAQPAASKSNASKARRKQAGKKLEQPQEFNFLELYPAALRKIIERVELCFCAAAREPAFRAQYDILGPRHFRSLHSCFDRHQFVAGASTVLDLQCAATIRQLRDSYREDANGARAELQELIRVAGKDKVYNVAIDMLGLKHGLMRQLEKPNPP